MLCYHNINRNYKYILIGGMEMEKINCARLASWRSHMNVASKDPIICLGCSLRINCESYLEGNVMRRHDDAKMPKVKLKWYGELKLKT